MNNETLQSIIDKKYCICRILCAGESPILYTWCSMWGQSYVAYRVMQSIGINLKGPLPIASLCSKFLFLVSQLLVTIYVLFTQIFGFVFGRLAYQVVRLFKRSSLLNFLELAVQFLRVNLCRSFTGPLKKNYKFSLIAYLLLACE